MPMVLLVDGEPGLRQALTEFLKREPFNSTKSGGSDLDVWYTKKFLKNMMAGLEARVRSTYHL